MLSVVRRPRTESAISADRDVPPNIVLITFCTVRADRLGAYGYELADTPMLDALAAESVVFDSHYAQASYSGGSFATILTGKYCCGHGIFDHPMAMVDEQVTAAQVLREAGYHTAGFVTHSYLRKKYRYDLGFEEFSVRERAGKQADAAVDWIGEHRHEPFFLWY